MLIRFIDLGLLLLMAFLTTANLAARIQVPLPHGAAASAQAFRIEFGSVTAQVLPKHSETAMCQVRSLEDLRACLRALRASPAPFLLAPVGTATIQRLVQVMDLCEVENLECLIAPTP